MDTELSKRMEERNERIAKLYDKPISELARMIVALEDEVEKMKDYRTMLMKIKYILTPEDEKRGRGRPKKGEEVI